MTNIVEYVERAKNRGVADAQSDIDQGINRCDEEVIADTEALVYAVTGKKLHEYEEDEENIVIAIVETYDEAYIDTYVNEVIEDEYVPE